MLFNLCLLVHATVSPMARLSFGRLDRNSVVAATYPECLLCIPGPLSRSVLPSLLVWVGRLGLGGGAPVGCARSDRSTSHPRDSLG